LETKPKKTDQHEHQKTERKAAVVSGVPEGIGGSIAKYDAALWVTGETLRISGGHDH
jgi:hypothetical protein